MDDDKITLIVRVPVGKRAIVTMRDTGVVDMQRATVVGGTEQAFFADHVRAVIVEEGEPHSSMTKWFASAPG